MIKTILIGCGRVGKKHAELLARQLDETKLVLACDIIPEQAIKFGLSYNSTSYPLDCDDLDQLDIINDVEPDLIVLATPSGYHFQHLRNLVRFDVPILVEKPACLRLEQIGQLMPVIPDDNEFWICEVKQNRYNVAVRKLKEAMPRLGKIHLASVQVLWSREQGYYQDWHGDWAMAGGVLANQAIHHIDLLWWLLGDVKRVSAFATYSDYTEVETSLVATLEFESGAIGTVEVTTLTRPKDLEGSLTILGDGGTVKLGGFAVNQIELWDFVEFESGDLTIFGCGENPPDVYGYGHLELYKDVIRYLKHDGPPPVPLWQARKSIEIVHAIYESVETGRVVDLQGHYKHSRLGR